MTEELEFIPLQAVPAVRPEEREAMRTAVVQVIRHLLLERVAEEERVPLFPRAYELLDRAGWGLDELAGALDPGPDRERLFAALGL